MLREKVAIILTISVKVIATFIFKSCYPIRI